MMVLSRRTMMRSTTAALVLAHRWRGISQIALPALQRRGDAVGVDPAYLSNGLVGIRPGRIPLMPAPACVAGFVYLQPEHRVECLSPAPYPLTMDIRVNGVSLLDSPERCALTSQRLEMSDGELTTEFTFDAGNGVTASITVRQLALRPEPSLLWQRIEIRPSAAGRVEVTPQISTAGVPGRVVTEGVPTGGRADCALLFDSGLSRLGVAVLVKAEPSFTVDQHPATYSGDVRAGAKYTFDTLASMVSSFYHPEPDIEAIRLVNWGDQTGVEHLIDENRRAWSELWKSRVVVTDPDDQRGLDAAFFYLHASNHRSNLNGMGPFGLSSSRYYMGHSFWDTETWCFLPLLLASPHVAESLMLFRRRGLDAAKKAAALFGYRGAQFPWEAAPTDGAEVTPVFAATGWAEQHIVPDVALAFWQYQMAAGDKTFLTDATWPVLRAVAEWIESRGVKTQRGFEILNIMGPDEASNGLNNSAYVNLACRAVMKAAIRCATTMEVQPPASWQQIAETIFLPMNANGVLTIAEQSQNDAFDDISFLQPFDVEMDSSVLERTWEAHRSVKQTGQQIGFAMAAEAALTAAMGDRAAAARMFRDAWAPDWLEPFGMAREAAPQTHGCFLTNFGALLRTAMLGFTGLRVSEGEWNRYEATLPENWKSIEIERIYIRGEKKRVVAQHGKKAQILDAV
jgi:trehalose/maltose hydrolase-like predicted phosphorylase